MNEIVRCIPLMGTYIEVSAAADNSNDFLLAVTEKVFARIIEMENCLSFFKIDSELSYINKHAYKKTCSISNEMRDVLEHALKLSELTDGLFDVSVAGQLVKHGFLPNDIVSYDINERANYKDIILEGNEVRFQKKLIIDLGGIAKGYSVDQALTAIDEEVSLTVNAGGDLAMNQWQGKIANIRVPFSRNVDVVEMEIKNRAVATSSNHYFAKGRSPIINPKSKNILQERRSVSVFAESCVLADALTKVAFLDPNYQTIFTDLGAEAVFINEQGKIC